MATTRFIVRPLVGTALAIALAAPPLPALAQETPAARPATEQVIVPQVERREIKRPRFASKDIALGVYGGTYATQNFGAAAVTGLRLGYHITEDVFVDATYGRSKVSDEDFRQVLPGGIFVQRSQTLSYYALSAGWNLLPGEVFFGSSGARATQGYIVGGVGSTSFAGRKNQTFHLGFGLRLMLWDQFALQADVRDHIFSTDLLGRRQSTQNLEVTAGLTFYF